MSPPRSFAISQRSIDSISPRCDRKFKPIALLQNQTAADMNDVFTYLIKFDEIWVRQMYLGFYVYRGGDCAVFAMKCVS